MNNCYSTAVRLTRLTGSASITTCTVALPGVSRLISGVRTVKLPLMAFSCISFNYNISNEHQPFTTAIITLIHYSNICSMMHIFDKLSLADFKVYE